MMITSITKEGSTLVILTDERPKPFKFDCKEKKLYSFTGRQVKHMNPILSNSARGQGQSLLIQSINGILERDNTYNFNRLEPFLLYLDLVDAWSFARLPDKCPKGYIKWVQENNFKINEHSLNTFNAVQKTKNLSPRVKETFDIITKGMQGYYRFTQFAKNATLEQITVLCKIFTITVKDIVWDLTNEINEFLDKIYKDWEKIVDTNRNFEYNGKLLDNYRYKERNDKIIAFESEILDIENLSNNKFKVVVPRTMDDFTNEGKMQNNCVGYFYHDSIASHRDIVYFIRKVENPNHSYITNRYNIRDKKTVETRTGNNGNNNDKSALELIKAIDNRIRELLEKETA